MADTIPPVTSATFVANPDADKMTTPTGTSDVYETDQIKNTFTINNLDELFHKGTAMSLYGALKAGDIVRERKADLLSTSTQIKNATAGLTFVQDYTAPTRPSNTPWPLSAGDALAATRAIRDLPIGGVPDPITVGDSQYTHTLSAFGVNEITHGIFQAPAGWTTDNFKTNYQNLLNQNATYTPDKPPSETHLQTVHVGDKYYEVPVSSFGFLSSEVGQYQKIYSVDWAHAQQAEPYLTTLTPAQQQTWDSVQNQKNQVALSNTLISTGINVTVPPPSDANTDSYYVLLATYNAGFPPKVVPVPANRAVADKLDLETPRIYRGVYKDALVFNKADSKYYYFEGDGGGPIDVTLTGVNTKNTAVASVDKLDTSKAAAAGTIVYNKDDNSYYYYDTQWRAIFGTPQAMEFNASGETSANTSTFGYDAYSATYYTPITVTQPPTQSAISQTFTSYTEVANLQEVKSRVAAQSLTPILYRAKDTGEFYIGSPRWAEPKLVPGGPVPVVLKPKDGQMENYKDQLSRKIDALSALTPGEMTALNDATKNLMGFQTFMTNFQKCMESLFTNILSNTK